MAHEIWIGLVVAFASGIIQGCTGFGLGLVAAPPLMIVLPPVAVVPVVLMMSTVNTAVAAFHARRQINPRIVIPLALGAAIGLPVGIYTLKQMDAGLFKVLVGILVLFFAAAMLAGWRRPFQNERRALLPVGLMSGFLGGSTSMGGPPVILFLANQQTPKEIFRASLLCFFFAGNCLALTLLYFNGLMTWDVVRHAAILLPGLLVGTGLGMASSHRIPELVFHRLAMILVACMGALLFFTSLRHFL